MLNHYLSSCLRRAALAAPALALAITLGASSARAGEMMMPLPPSPEPEFCFDQNLRSFDVYGGYRSIQFDDVNLEDEDGWVAGIGANLYFNRYAGVGLEGTYFAAADTTNFSGAANLLLRLPIDAICMAPYALIGGGYTFGDIDQSFWQAGVGLEWKMNQYVGLFGDARMIFTTDDADSQMYRGGLRFNF